MAPARSEAWKGPVRDIQAFLLFVSVTVTFFNLCTTVVLAAPTKTPLSTLDLHNPGVKDGLSDNGSLETQFHTGPGPTIVKGTENETLEYEASLILECEAYGDSKPNVSWEYNGKPLPNNFLIPVMRESPGPQYHQDDLDVSGGRDYNNNTINNNKSQEGDHQDSSGSGGHDLQERDYITRVDFKLPKMNMAFYGTFTCKAVNEDGVSSKSYLIIPNANSSVFMKLVRGSIAIFSLVLSIAIYRFFQVQGARRKVQRYEKLPPRDLQIIQSFRKGASKTSTSKPTHPYPSQLSATTTLNDSLNLLGGNSSSNMHSNEKVIEINSWINHIAYNDRKDVLKDSFNINFENILQSTEYGLLLSGSFRSPKTRTWQPVGVKMEKGDKETSSTLEGLLMELKILASLAEENDFIVNLQAATTNKLYKRQVYVFLDFCENGTLDKYIDLNRTKFRDLFARTQNETEDKSTVPKRKFRIAYEGSDENQNPSPTSGKRAWRFSTEELVVWAAEIADGMRFLHKNKIGHGNLCAANVFLTDGLVAKIGNIGRAPKESEKESRRYPPEFSLRHEYSLKSDAWSYGMTLWEMFSLRQQQLPSDQDLADFYSSGKGIPSATKSNKDLDEIRYLCWNPDETLRPDFEHLSESARLILNTLHP